MSVVWLIATAGAAPVAWVDWESGSAGANGVAAGVIHAATGDVAVDYTGEIAFLQTSGGTDYWVPSAPYESAIVDNAPPDSDILALSTATTKTLTFSEPVDNLFFAVVSLNGNGYRFDSDFEVVSFGAGFWGNGTLARVDNGDGTFSVVGTGEPHGVIRFTGAVSTITWDSLSNEFWNGFTVGTYGIAVLDADGDGVPDDADLCPLEDASGFDQDGDGCVDDTDGDGVLDDVDLCPLEDATGFDQDGDGCLDPAADGDGDGVDDGADVCPAEPDPLQRDTDGDGVGNACTLALTIDLAGAVPVLRASGLAAGERVRFFHTSLSAANIVKHAVRADANGDAALPFRVPPGTAPGTRIAFRAAAVRPGDTSVASATVGYVVP